MEVSELLQKLGRFDPELDVLCYSEDADLLPPKHIFRLLEINDINFVEGEKRRGDDQIPSIKVGRSRVSQKHVIIDVTSDF